MATSIDHALKCKARMVLADERAISVLPASERIAVAFILDRADLFPHGYSMLDAVTRLGSELTEAARRVQSAGVQCCEESADG
jgi:ABC-type uncharacterized transport system YnjBCD ATPase subunit